MKSAKTTTQVIREGKANISVPKARPSKAAPVFYNPVMALQRSLNIALISEVDKKGLQIADILAGSGVRGIRFFKELPKSKIKKVSFNDGNPNAAKLLKKNLKLNKIPASRYSASKKDASAFLLESKGFDYIDIDPFGPPGPFLDAACKKLGRHGILAVTATDTAALVGSAPAACRRKYWATPMKNEFMHETGMRILARKAQLVAAQYDKALQPIYCHSTEHYMRLYLAVQKSRNELIRAMERQGFIHYCRNCLNRFASSSNEPAACTLCNSKAEVAGPLWLGRLWDSDLAMRIAKHASKAKLGTEVERLAWTIAEEAKLPEAVGYYETHEWARKLRFGPPKREQLIDALVAKGLGAAPTHFSPTGIRTDAKPEQFKEIFESLASYKILS
jgi:tRNA (guanine26-N2/guanine27-N2)-dimethyltransferase